MKNQKLSIHIKLYLLCVLALASCGIANSTAPTAAIPILEAGKTPIIDGKLDEKIWKNAAHIRNITLKGSGAFAGVTEAKGHDSAPIETDFFVCYDKNNMYIAAECYEYAPGYPEAYPREPQNTIILNDDAVQFVIGGQMDEEVKGESLEMGGYDGAYGKLSDAQFYYTYTVNSAGARMRTFNETPLKRPLFDAAVGRDGKNWCVEMKVPFSSSGINIKNSKEIFANLLRIRPPDMMGWYLPRYGHYSDMPFGTFRFLSKNQKSKITKEVRKSNLRKKTPVIYDIKIGYYPLSGKVVGTISQTGSQTNDYAVMELTKYKSKKIKLDSISEYWKYQFKQSGGIYNKSDVHNIIFDIPKGTQSVERKAILTLFNSKGKKIKQVTRTLEPVKAPDWFGAGDKIGVEYLKDKILKDWKTPRVKGKTIILANKKMIIAKNGLFSKIIDKNGNLLSKPCRLLVSVNGKILPFIQIKQKISLDGNKVRIYSLLRSRNVVCEVKTCVDYDGFTIVKLRVSGVPPKQINRIALEIPLKRDRAEFVYREVAEETERLDKYGYSGLAGQTWVGDHEGGIAFTFDTFDLFLSENRRKQISITEKDNTRSFTMNFVDRPGQINDEQHVFRFFLLPTPTKKAPRQKVREHYITKWETWTPMQGYPDTNQISKLQDWLKSDEMKGKKGLLYVGHGLQVSAPDYKKFQEDFDIAPKKIVYWRGGKDKNKNACYLTSKIGPAGDQQLWNMNQILSNVKISGIISDGFSYPWGDDNPSHKGNLYQRAVWKTDTPSRIVLMRNFLKQYFGMFQEKNPEYHMMDHTGGSFRFPTSSMFDSYLDGEPLGRFKHGYQLPLSKFFSFTGQAWGPRSIFWEKRWRKGRGIFWSYTYAFLHDVEVSNDPTKMNYLIFDEFDDEENTDFLPYWKQNPYVKLNSNHSKMSCYLKTNAALIAVGNFTYDDDSVKLDISKLFKNRKIRVQDMLTGRDLKLNGRIICKKVDGWKLMLIKVTPIAEKQKKEEVDNVNVCSGKTKPAAKQNKTIVIKSSKPSDWQLPKPFREMGWEKVKLEKRNAIKLTSRKYGAFSKMMLKNLCFGKNAYIHLKISLNGRWNICYGPVTMKFWPNLQMIGNLYGWNEGYINKTVKLRYDKPNDVIVSVSDGVFTVIINGTVSARDMHFNLPDSNENSLSFITWAGDEITVDVIEIENKSKQFLDKIKQPVL